MEKFDSFWQDQNYCMINKGDRRFIAGVKWPRRDADHSPPRNARVTPPPTPLGVPMAHIVNSLYVPLVQLRDVPELSG